MTDEEWAAKIVSQCGSEDSTEWRDTEGDHVRADEILCDLLIELGYKKTVEAWGRVAKWYA